MCDIDIFCILGLGKRGDEVSVRPNFAYNKLLLPGLAVYPTPENKTKYLSTEDATSDELHSSPYAERVS
jgi:large subunit ribosomal protein L9